MPRFLFRFDVSPRIGTGHLRRCLTLASELKEQHRAFVFFACKSVDFDLAGYLHGVVDGWTVLDWSSTPESDAQKVIQIYRQQEIDIAVIDHYQADVEYQKALHGSGIRWLQFDGSARQPLWADWVLNASPATDEAFYLPLKQKDATCFLLGPAYALLRREFHQWRPKVTFRKEVRRVLLTFGGGDDRGATVFCLEAMKSLDRTIERVALVSSANPRRPEIMHWGSRNNDSNVMLLVDEEEIARCMVSADLAITAGGTTTFETAAMGLPSLIIQTADNQELNAKSWDREGAAKYVGLSDSLTSSALRRHVVDLANSPSLRKSMACIGRSLVDCLGARRVAKTLLSASTDSA